MKTSIRCITLWLFLTVLLSFLPTQNVQAISCTWDGSSGPWEDGTRWSCEQPPGPSDDATIPGGVITLSSDASVKSLSLYGGTLTGSGGLTAETINWYAGTMQGPGTTTVTESLGFLGSADINLLNRTLINAKAATWFRSGDLYLNNSAILNNQLGATFTIHSAGATIVHGEGDFTNDGTLIMASSVSTSAFSLRFVNSISGTVSAEQGTLVINNSTASPSNGNYNVLHDAVLQLNGLYAPYNLEGIINGTGNGTIEIAGIVNINGTFTFSGTVSITGINYGRLNLSSDSTTADINILNMSDTNGTLMGPGHLTADTIYWSSGTMKGTGSTTASNALNFSGSATIDLIDGRTFNNAGTATWNKTGYLYINPAAANFNNQAGASFIVQSCGATIVSGGGTFSNAGTFTYASPGSSAISLGFINSSTGTVSVWSGTLEISNTIASVSPSSGAYNVLSGAALRLRGANAPYNLSGNIIGSGTGTIEIAGVVNIDGAFTFPGTISITGINYGRLNLSTDATTANINILDMSDPNGTLKGPGHLTAGTINWSGGAMTGTGSTTATNLLNFTGSTTINLIDGRTFNNAGTATWNKTGYLYINPATTSFNNQAGATFTVKSCGTTIVSGGGIFTNAGTFTYACPDSSAISLGFINSSTGTVSVESGTLEISNMIASVSPSSGAYNVLSGATLRLRGASAPYNLSGNITGTGTGTIEIAGVVNIDGTFTFTGTISITGINYGRMNLSTASTTANINTLEMSDTNGTLMGPGHLTAGTINWSSGTMKGTGSTTASNALNFSGSATINLIEGRTFNNAGTATWNKSGYLYINPATASFNNQTGASFTVQSSGTTIVSGGGTFKNAGTLNLTTGNIATNTFTQEAGGITNLAMRGTTPVTDYSQLMVSNLILSGPLNISFVGGYTPHVSDYFILQQYSSTRTGNFSPVNITPIPDIIWVWFYQNRILHLWALRYQIFIPLLFK